MLQFIPMIMSLLQGQKAKADAANQGEIDHLRGNDGGGGTPPPQKQDTAQNLLGGLQSVMGGGEKKPDPLAAPAPGGGGLSKGTTGMLDNEFGKPDTDDQDLLNM